MRPLPSLPCLLAAAVLLAGCSGSQAPADAGGADPDAPGPGDGGEGGAGLTVLRSALGAPLDHVVWANGTVAAQDTCNAGGCILDDRAFHPTDLTGHLVAGVPVRLEAELAHVPPPLVFGGFDLWVDADEATFYSYVAEFRPDGASLAVTFLPSGPAQVVVAAYSPGGEVPETRYTLRIRLAADPEVVLPGVPVAVELGPGSTLEAEDDRGPAAFVLFGPDGRRIGRHEGTVTLPGTAAVGDHVVLLPPDTAGARLSTDSGATTLAPRGLRYELGEAGTVPQHGAYEAAWQVAGDPIAAGFRFFTEAGPADQAALVSAGFSARLTGPGGFTFETGNVCGFCLTLGGFSSWEQTPVGDERVVAGDYQVRVESQGTYEVRAAPYAVYVE